MNLKRLIFLFVIVTIVAALAFTVGLRFAPKSSAYSPNAQLRAAYSTDTTAIDDELWQYLLDGAKLMSNQNY